MTIASKFINAVEPQLRRILVAVRRLERHLGPEDDWVESVRRVVCTATDPLLRPLGRPTIRQKGRADYITTVKADSRTVENVLAQSYQRNVLSTKKYRVKNNQPHEQSSNRSVTTQTARSHRQWADGSWVLDSGDTPWQHHVYLFRNADGSTDIYGHTEPSVRNPSEHSHGEQSHGDHNGRIRQLFSDSNHSHSSRTDYSIPPQSTTMKYSKTKKTLLGTAISLITAATTMLVKGQYYEGGAIMAIAALCVVAYDVLDDKAKQSLSDAVDAKMLTEIGKVIGSEAKETVESQSDK